MSKGQISNDPTTAQKSYRGPVLKNGLNISQNIGN